MSVSEEQVDAVAAETAEEVEPVEVAIPAGALVLLVGASGSGKTTFARGHLAASQVLSSDAFRLMVSDDENDQSATVAAFEALHLVAGRRLERGLLTVVDATNVQASARASLVELAREHDAVAVAVVLDVEEAVCQARNAARTDRVLPSHVISRHVRQLRKSVRGLAREGFKRVHVLSGASEVSRARVAVERARHDAHEVGACDLIGDVQGCLAELVDLLEVLGYVLTRDSEGRAVDASHPEGRVSVLLGGLVGAGPDSLGVLRLVRAMVASGSALAVPGAAEDRLVKALRGRAGDLADLPDSLSGFAALEAHEREELASLLWSLPSHLVLADSGVVASHHGLPERYQGRASGRVRGHAVHGRGVEEGADGVATWVSEYRGGALVVHGAGPVRAPERRGRTICVDTGCVHGGALTALRHPEEALVSVPAHRVHQEHEGGWGCDAAQERDPGTIQLRDVLGRRVVETAHAGAVTIREEQAGAALEVSSRFALHPASVLHLPATMSPVSASSLPGTLEHPAEALAWYRSEGVEEIVCEEKHMGSRAVVLVRRGDLDADPTRAPHERGAVHTRTGRSFFDLDTTTVLLRELAAAVASAGLFDELQSPWVLLDCELLPWSAKAEELVRGQYASVGAAARASLPPAAAALAAAAARGQDVGALRERVLGRIESSQRFVETYRRYCWETEGLHGVQIAPFQILASEGRTFAEEHHLTHLAWAARLAAAAPARVIETQHLHVSLADDGADSQVAAWWEALCAVGGEGMVVKPPRPLTRGRRGLVQPGLKVRGREYLRMVYGPEYLEETNLERLRNREVGRKRSLALREHAVGLEGLERLASGEPLWRIHDCVSAVLALESEPVDTRL